MSEPKCPHPAAFFKETEYFIEIDTDTELADGFFGHVLCDSGNFDLTLTLGSVGASQSLGNPVITVVNMSSGTGVVTISGATETLTVAPGASQTIFGHSDQWIPIKLQAAKTLYNNSGSSLSATDVKAALDELSTEKVDGPASAVDENVAVYNGATGKLIKDGGSKLSEYVKGPESATDERIAVFDGTTGKLIKDSGVSVASVTDHGSLSGLADDDHTQYHNDTRGDARYSLLGHNHDATYAAIANGVTNGDSHDHSGGDGAQIAYGSLSGTPTIPDELSDLADDATHRLVTDTEKSTWNAKQDALIADTDYLTPGTAASTYEPLKGPDDNYVTDAEKTVIGNTSGTNTGDQSASDFNHDDLSAITGTVGEYNHPNDAQMTVLGNTSGTNTGDQSASDFNHDDLSSITGTPGEYNHPTDAQMTVLGNTSGTNTGDQNDHGTLDGLSDDDHAQYHNDTRGDARYSLLGHNHDATYAAIANGVTNGDSHDHSGGDGAQIAYGSLSGTPTIPDELSDLADDATHRLVTDTEKSTWNGKQDALVADTDYLTPGTAASTYEPVRGADDNYVTDAEKIVIGNTSGTNTGDQVIPDELADLSDDSTHRLVTDTEKATWNAKQDALVADTDYLTPGTAASTYEPAKGPDDNYVTDAEKTVIGNTSGTNTGDQSASDFNHDDLSAITGTPGEYNHPTDAQMTVLGNTSGTNTGDQNDHGTLDGLSDDDHTQYHNDTRGDARYSLLGHNHDATYAPIANGVTNGDSHDHSGGDGAQIDHGGLAGLSDDDHSQYHNDTRAATWLSGVSSVSGYGWVLDEDSMSSDSATKVPTQQSTKAYVDSKVLSAKCYIQQDSSQSLSDTTYSAINWDNEITDTDTMWSSGKPSRLYCKTAGVYNINTSVRFASNSTGVRFIAIAKNGTHICRQNQNATVGYQTYVIASLTITLAVDDYIEVYAFQTSGGNLNISDAASRTYISMTQVM